jgi:hypothetical protein
VDGAGNLLIADFGSERILVVAASTGTFYGQAMTAGDIYTVAGDGTEGFSGDGGPATSAELSLLRALYAGSGVAVDSAGNLVIADSYNRRIRVVAASTGTFYGQQMTAGDIYTIAGDGTIGFSGDGGPATAAELIQPGGVAVDGHGNVLISDISNGRDRALAASDGTFYGQAMTAGDIYTIAGNGLKGFSSNGEPATAAEFPQPAGVATDSAGNLIITGADRVLVAAARSGTFYGHAMPAGHLYTVAGDGNGDGDGDGDIGDGGPGPKATLGGPLGVAMDGAGNLLIADRGNNRIRVVAASTGTFYGQAMTAGDIYTVAGHGTFGAHGNGVPATATQLGQPTGVAVDGAGNLVIALEGSSKIRVVADSTGTFYGQAMTAGDIYTIAGDGTRGFAGDQGKAVRAELDYPFDVAVDGAGNILIADTGNQRIRVVAGSTGSFYGQQMTAGNIYTLAGDGNPGFAGDGGPATAAELSGPLGVAVDSAGNTLIADTGNQRIRVVAASTGSFYGQQMTTGDIYTITGGGTSGLGDGGPATAASLSDPGDVAVGGTGNILIADTGNDRIREVQEPTTGP